MSSDARGERLYREQGPKLWRSLVGYTANPEVASDALAEAFAQLLKRGDAVEDASAWVWTAAFRIAAGEMKRMQADAPTVPLAEVPAPEDVSSLVEALRLISPNQRVAVILHDYADRPVAEVCDVLGIARATAYVHLSQGRRRLRRLLEDSDDG